MKTWLQNWGLLTALCLGGMVFAVWDIDEALRQAMRVVGWGIAIMAVTFPIQKLEYQDGKRIDHGAAVLGVCGVFAMIVGYVRIAFSDNFHGSTNEFVTGAGISGGLLIVAAFALGFRDQNEKKQAELREREARRREVERAASPRQQQGRFLHL
jgi:hydrogenase/urease accessory protein HupE